MASQTDPQPYDRLGKVQKKAFDAMWSRYGEVWGIYCSTGRGGVTLKSIGSACSRLASIGYVVKGNTIYRVDKKRGRKAEYRKRSAGNLYGSKRASTHSSRTAGKY